jgi:deoxyribodipyrimidine photo-lyase
MKTAILWFRNDLRLYDNPALKAALETAEKIIPVYVIDDRYLQQDRWGIVRTGPYRLRFLLESLADLKEHLREKGSDLLIKRGTPEAILPDLVNEYRAGTIFAAKEYAHEEVQVEDTLGANLDLQLFHSSPLVHPEDVPFAADNAPDVFTAFRKKVEKYAEIRSAIPTPDSVPSPELPNAPVPTFSDLGMEDIPADDRGVLAFKGGAVAGDDRLDHYLWESDAVATYKETRNGLIGADYSTKFSPWLANGSMSPRTIYHELERYEQEVTKNKSTYWVKFELLWRDYFKYVTMKYGRKIFSPGGIQDKSVSWRDNDTLFQKWQNGQTGDDFVDANMRELKETGFMSNRGRQNVASYLVHQLKIDWRKGAAWFESLLIDYDVCSNWGNWMYASGVGNDPRDRVFNTKKQANQYDADGAYRRLWNRV